MSVMRFSPLLRGILLGAAVTAVSFSANAQEKHYRFAYDQPHTTGYGIVGDTFAAKLKELSKGQFIIDQYPGAQLGQEPQVLQLLKSGDIDFCISSSANAATVSPQAGVMSLHFLFRSEEHLTKAIADPRLAEAFKAMIEGSVQGAHVIGLATLGLRSMYSKKEIHNIGDIKGLKVRVQATPTEDAIFPAYGAQTVHMPFGSVYTSLQTGVVDVAENGINVYLANKHYEVAPVLSLTEQTLAEPLGRAEAMGAGGSRRGQQDPAGQGVRAGARFDRQAQGARRQGRQRRRQVRLYENRRPVSGQVRHRAWTRRGQDQKPDHQH